ncbi:Serrate RNA effector molecule [Globisporangium polare]
MTPLLTDEMRAATRQVHDISDKLVNVKLLIALTNNELYGRSVLLFYCVYAQLEASIEACKEHESLRELHQLLPQFARADKIAKDLKFFLGEDWSDKFKPTPAALAYVKHLKELEKKNPTLLLSYFYHMYTALLAGGQMIKKVVKKSFDPPEGEGLNTFDFESKSRMALRSALKDKVNSVTMDDATKQLVLAESLKCFKMNNDIVRSIEGSGRQLAAWILKWLVVLGLIYLASRAFFV